jgi:transcriptional regulator with XRE-family HTH domain
LPWCSDSWHVSAVPWKNAQTSQGEPLNTALRSAMQTAGLSPRQLAARVGVSGKTVERWVADAALIPHARNREDACKALGVDEEMIWPKAVKDRIKTGGDREIIRSYPYRSACPSTVWGELIADATEELFFAGYTNYFLWLDQPAFVATLRQKLDTGCRVRFLVGDPDGEVTRNRETIEDVALTVSTRIRITLEHLGKLGSHERLETRFSAPGDAANHVSLSVFRFDNEALVTPHLARLVGHDSPMLHLRRHENGGMFDRFAEHAEELWTRGIQAERMPAAS